MNKLPPPRIIYDLGQRPRAGEGQCDCACVTAVPLTPASSSAAGTDCACSDDCACAAPLPADTPYVLAPSLQDLPLTETYRVAFTEQGKTAVLNHTAHTIARHFATPRPLHDYPVTWTRRWGVAVDDTLQTLTNLQLLLPHPATAAALAEQPARLTAWLHVTDRCNLRCAYCYLPHKRADMSRETGRAAIDATIRSALRHGYPGIKLKYAGGEPLIRFAEVMALHRYAQGQTAVHDLALDGVVLSNGTLLTPERAATMHELGLRLMISLDGRGEAHDGQRFYANGHGSFADVARGIDTAVSLGLVPDISVTVTSRNAAALPDLVSWLLCRDLPFSLNFYRENDYAETAVGLRLQEQKIIDGMRAAFAEIEANLPRRSLLASLVDRANLAVPHLRTCGAGHSYLVFSETGQVSKCQMHQRAAVTDLNDPDPLHTIRLDAVGLQNLPVTEKEGCRNCAWRYWCTGGCPLATWRATGRYDVKSPNCRIYKTLYPEVVRLEGLRLLRAATG